MTFKDQVLLTLLYLTTLCRGWPSNQPVIGVLLKVSLPGVPIANHVYYTMASYKSFIEQAGGGAVPLFVDQPDSYYEQLLPRLNGVLLPGGGSNILTSPYSKVAKKVFQMAKKMNDAGVYFPVWGTCLGMEEMTTWPLASQQDILSNCTGTEAIPLPINFTQQAKTSKLYGEAPPYILDILAKKKITPNFHSFCLSMQTYQNNDALKGFYTVTSTNTDSAGLVYASSMEAKGYPFYGVQWHPEMINYWHSKETEPGITNSLDGALVSQYHANFFVEEVRHNNNSFKSYEEEGRFLFNKYHSIVVKGLETYVFTDLDVPYFD